MNKIKELIKSANLNFKKEMTFNLTVNLVLIAGAVLLCIFSKNIIYFWPFLILILVFNLCVMYRYALIKNKLENAELKDIKQILNFLYINLNNGENIETSLNNIKSVSSLKSIENLNDLLAGLKKKNDLLFYLQFSKKYKSVNLDNLMAGLYTYKKDKTKENLNTINQSIFEIESSINSKKIESNKFEIINTSPILGAFIAVLIFIVSIVLITGSYIHG